MKNKILTTLLLTVLSVVAIYGQNLNKSKLDSLLNILAEKNKAMGSLTISKNGNVVYSRAIGYSFLSDKEKIPATEKTIYRIGSISKMFTTTMIFQLIEESEYSDESVQPFWTKVYNCGVEKLSFKSNDFLFLFSHRFAF